MKLLEHFTHFFYYKAVWKLYRSYWENWSWKQQVTQCHVLVSRSKMALEFSIWLQILCLPTDRYTPLRVYMSSYVHYTRLRSLQLSSQCSVFTVFLPVTRSTHGGHCHESKGIKAGKGDPSAGETVTDNNIMYTEGIEPISLYAGQKM